MNVAGIAGNVQNDFSDDEGVLECFEPQLDVQEHALREDKDAEQEEGCIMKKENDDTEYEGDGTCDCNSRVSCLLVTQCHYVVTISASCGAVVKKGIPNEKCFCLVEGYFEQDVKRLLADLSQKMDNLTSTVTTKLSKLEETMSSNSNASFAVGTPTMSSTPSVEAMTEVEKLFPVSSKARLVELDERLQVDTKFKQALVREATVLRYVLR